MTPAAEKAFFLVMLASCTPAHRDPAPDRDAGAADSSRVAVARGGTQPTCRDDVEVKWPGEWHVTPVESEECEVTSIQPPGEVRAPFVLHYCATDIKEVKAEPLQLGDRWFRPSLSHDVRGAISGQVEVDFRDVTYQLLLEIDHASRPDVVAVLNLLRTFRTRLVQCDGGPAMPLHRCSRPCDAGWPDGPGPESDGGMQIVAKLVDRVFR